MLGLNFTMSCSIKMYLNKFKVDISSHPFPEDHRSSDARPYARDDPYVQTIML